MKSPLQADKELVEEFGIDEASDLDPTFKLGYVRSQIDEFKKVIFRNRVDALISLNLIELSQKAKDEAMESKARENLTNYRNVIKQMTGAVELMEQLKDELEPLASERSEP
jgi:hypothetical protein